MESERDVVANYLSGLLDRTIARGHLADAVNIEALLGSVESMCAEEYVRLTDEQDEAPQVPA